MVLTGNRSSPATVPNADGLVLGEPLGELVSPHARLRGESTKKTHLTFTRDGEGHPMNKNVYNVSYFFLS